MICWSDHIFFNLLIFLYFSLSAKLVLESYFYTFFLHRHLYCFILLLCCIFKGYILFSHFLIDPSVTFQAPIFKISFHYPILGCRCLYSVYTFHCYRYFTANFIILLSKVDTWVNEVTHEETLTKTVENHTYRICWLKGGTT